MPPSRPSLHPSSTSVRSAPAACWTLGPFRQLENTITSAIQRRQRHARDDVIVVRFADDFPVGFQHKSDAEQFLAELRERFRKYNLELLRRRLASRTKDWLVQAPQPHTVDDLRVLTPEVRSRLWRS